MPAVDGATASPTPVRAGAVRHAHTANAVAVALQFKTAAPGLNYGNLFQTGDGPEALRVELQPTGTLLVVFAGGGAYPAAARIEPDRSYSLRLEYERGRALTVFLDRRQVLYLDDPRLLARPPDLSNIMVGTGMAQQRGMIGAIHDFTLRADYTYTRLRANVARLLLLLVAGTLFLFLLPRPARQTPLDARPDAGEEESHAGWVAAIFGAVLGAAALALLVLLWKGNPTQFGTAKWVVHLILPPAVIAAIIFIAPWWFRSPWSRGLAMLPVLTYAGAMIAAVPATPLGAVIVVLGLFGLLGYLWYQYLQRKEPVAGAGFWTYAHRHWPSLLLSVVVFVVGWAALNSLMNWDAYRRMLETHYVLSIVGTLIVFRLILDLVFAPAAGVGVQPLERGKVALSSFALGGVSILLMLWASFRADMLFLPGAEYHWEYFVGAIRGIASGGWLLWDTPSQYGFLNIVLASLMPGATVWQQFYVFQALLLLGVSGGLYFTLLRCFPATARNHIVLLGAVMLAIFFADPEFIGPSPYPSSSVVRFLWVYISVLTLWYLPEHGRRQALVTGLVWALGVMWSAESAVYVTAIWSFNVAAIFLRQSSEPPSVSLAVRYLVAACASLAGLLLLISVYYLVRLGVVPDFRSLFDHALGYAAGFGYVPFPVAGPGNILLLLFVGCVATAALLRMQPVGSMGHRLSPIAGMAGALWGIATYYIGRPVPQNITAMLPMLMMFALLATRVVGEMRAPAAAVFVRAAAIPLLFVIALPVFNIGWYKVLGDTTSWSSDVTAGLPSANRELQDLIQQVNPGLSLPMTYYGDEAAPPVLTPAVAAWTSTAWLPVPLQLLEVPISEARRAVYLKRSICRRQIQTGLIITGGGDAMSQRFAGFLREFEKYYRIDRASAGSTYTAYRFTNLDYSSCP